MPALRTCSAIRNALRSNLLSLAVGTKTVCSKQLKPGGQLLRDASRATSTAAVSCITPSQCAPRLLLHSRGPRRLGSCCSGICQRKKALSGGRAICSGAALPPLSTLPHYADLPLDKATHLRSKHEDLQALFNRDDARLVIFSGRKALVAPAERDRRRHCDDDSGSLSGGGNPGGAAVAADVAQQAQQLASAAAPDVQTTWQQATLKWQPAYLQPARDAVRFGYLSGSRRVAVAQASGRSSSDSGAVSHESAVFLGLDRSGAPLFAADLGPEPPLWPDADSALRASADSPLFGGLQAAAAAHEGGGSTRFTAERLQRLQLHALQEAAESAGSGASVDGEPSQGSQQLQAWAEQQHFEFVDIRRQGPHMTPGDAAILALAAGLLTWHGNNAFSGGSGAPMTMSEAGYSRKVVAPGDAATRPSLYPRIDPAVIMAVSHGDHLLLGRQARWEAGRYSLLAGFCEIGETLEQAVVRETAEEAGVAVDLGSVRYRGSQPWPFPQSLMLGFTAAAAPPPSAAPTGLQALGLQTRPFESLQQAEGKAAAQGVGLTAGEADAALGALPGAGPLPPVNPADAELEDARWFHRDWLLAALAGDSAALAGQRFAVPGTYSLSGRVIHQWLAEHSVAAAAGSGSGAEDGSAELAEPRGLDGVVDVQLDEGTFKYVLLRVSDADGRSKVIVRGHRHAAYHNDILSVVARKLGSQALQVDALGGGRIEHDPAAAAVKVYGYSSAFGAAPHEVSAALIRRWLPLHTVATSYEGY